MNYLLNNSIQVNYIKQIFFICVSLIFYSKIYGQRIYATTEQNSATALLASVTNSGRATDGNYTNYSTLNVTLGLVGLIFSQQNLQFTGTILPEPTSPIIIKFEANGAFLGLANNIQVQRTQGGQNGVVGSNYTANTLLDLINLNGDVNATEVSIPIPGGSTVSNGIRLRINTALGVALSARLYYAFFIAPPVLDNDTIVLCEGEEGFISISNFQTGYSYKLYDALTGGNLVGSTTTSEINSISSMLNSGTYYLEAVEPGTEYISSRTGVTIEIHPKPGNPEIAINNNED